MKNKILINTFVLAFFCILTLTVYAEEKDEIILKDGKVLKKPYIISRNPSGLNVGHQNGVIFVPFSEMSEKRQKQYNYDPKEAKKYKKRITKAQRRRQIRIAEQRKKGKTSNTGLVSFEEESFPEQSAKSQLEEELASLLRERARLERRYSQINSGQIKPRGGSSDNTYVSYRGGKVYRKKKGSYTAKEKKNFLDKRKLLKEISGELQRNKQRTITVRNLINRQTSKGIKVGKTVNK